MLIKIVVAIIIFVCLSGGAVSGERVSLELGASLCETVSGARSFQSEKKPFANQMQMVASLTGNYFVKLKHLDCGSDETYFVESSRRYVDPVSQLMIIGEVEERSVENLSFVGLDMGFRASRRMLSYRISLGLGVATFDEHHFRSSVLEDWQSRHQSGISISGEMGGYVELLRNIRLGVDVSLLALPYSRGMLSTYGMFVGMQW